LTEVQVFVKEALTTGSPKPAIGEALSQAGWPSDEVRQALDSFADVEFAIPVPRRRPTGSAREAFLYLVTFTALYTSAFALGVLLFGVIDSNFPDATIQYRSGPDYEGLRWCIASLVVAFPMYLWLTRQHLCEYARDAARRTSAVRKWLTYLTMFVAACVLIGTLITVIADVLGGQLAIAFVLKTAVVLGISGATFGFYRWEIRSADAVQP
jgi:hypothetical protein